MGKEDGYFFDIPEERKPKVWEEEPKTPEEIKREKRIERRENSSSMVLAALRNYFSNFSQLFFVMGVIYFTIIMFLLIFVRDIYLPIIAAPEQVLQSIVENVKNVFAKGGVVAVFQPDFLQQLLSSLFDPIVETDNELLKSVLTRLGSAAVLVIFSCKVARTFSRKSLRKKASRKNSLHGLLLLLVRTLSSVLFWAITFVLSYIWFFALFLMPIASLVLGAVQDLVTVRTIHFREIKMSEIFNLKNVVRLIASNLAMYLFNFIICGVTYLLTNFTVALVLAIPLFTYNAAVLDVTSTRYFKRLVDKGKLKTRAEALLEKQQKKENATPVSH